MFYVCDKIGDKYGVVDTDDGICEYYKESVLYKINEQVKIQGVSRDGITVLDKDLVVAKAKILGIPVINSDWIRPDSNHFMSFDYEKDLSVVANVVNCEDNSIRVAVPQDKYNSIKIINLINNSFFNNNICSYRKGLKLFILANSRLYTIEVFVKILVNIIGDKFTDLRDGYIESIFKIDDSSIVAKYTISSMDYAYVWVSLDDGKLKKLPQRDFYEYDDVRYKYYVCSFDRRGRMVL